MQMQTTHDLHKLVCNGLGEAIYIHVLHVYAPFIYMYLNHNCITNHSLFIGLQASVYFLFRINAPP